MKDLYSILSATIIILANSFYGFAQKTTYYFSSNTGEDKGQFITFIGDICFESNKAGKSVGHGNLQINQYQSNNSQTVYVGKSYWGDKTKFIFNSNKSEMTVSTSDGRTFCFQQKMPPANLTTCSFIRREDSLPSSGSPYADSYVPPIPNRAVTDPYNSSVNKSSSSSKSTSTRRTSTKHTCNLCNGKKRIERNMYPSMFGQTDYQVRCNECGKDYPKSWGHTHVTCPQCHGRGYFTTD